MKQLSGIDTNRSVRRRWQVMKVFLALLLVLGCSLWPSHANSIQAFAESDVGIESGTDMATSVDTSSVDTSTPADVSVPTGSVALADTSTLADVKTDEPSPTTANADTDADTGTPAAADGSADNISLLSETYTTGKTDSDTEYRFYVDKGDGKGSRWNIFKDSFLKVISSTGKTQTAWCVDITKLYPSGKSTEPTDALNVMPQANLDKIALAHDYIFERKGFDYIHLGNASWEQRYALLQTYIWWIMQLTPGTGMSNYAIYSAEVLNGEGGWGASWSGAWQELSSYVSANVQDYDGYATAFVSNEAQSVIVALSAKKKTGSVAIQKQSSNESVSGGNGCYWLSGARYSIYEDEACKAYYKCIETNYSGYVRLDNVPVGNYWVKEARPPTGYSLDETVYPITVKEDEVALVNVGAVSDVPQTNEIEILIRKYDSEKTCSPESNTAQGGATLEGAQFKVSHYGAFFDDGSNVPKALSTIDEVEPLRTWVFETDEEGRVKLSEDYKVSGDSLYVNDNGNTALPLGTYVIEEIKAPVGYLLNSEKIECAIYNFGTSALVDFYQTPEVANDIIRGDIELVKADGETMARMAGVPFEIISNTTGERHVIVTDENGCASTASEHALHSYQTNANDGVVEGDFGEDAEDNAEVEFNAEAKYNADAGIWFGSFDVIDDERGALIYDTYTINELSCAANAGYALVTGVTVTVSKDTQCIHLGTLNNYPIEPIRISTTATDVSDGDHEALANSELRIVDNVFFDNLEVGETYRIQGVVMDKSTGEELIVDGQVVTGETKFVAQTATGIVRVDFEFDGTGLGGSDTVVFETLYKQDEGENELLVAQHADWESTNQSITISEPDEPKTPDEPETPETPEITEVSLPGETYDKTGFPLEGVMLGLAALGAISCVLGIYGVRRFTRYRK